MFQGSIVAIVTPMTDDGSVDFVSLRTLVDWHVAAGTSAIVAVGTTGESTTLSSDEHIEVVQTVVQAAAGRLAVIAGNGSNSTAKAVALTRALQNSGAVACLCVTPYYNKPTQQGLYEHFMRIADCSELPQLLYNVPGRTGVDLLPATVARLSQHPRIIGIKEATGSLARLRELLALKMDQMCLLSGDDATGCEFILGGGSGVISVTANLAPVLMAEMCRQSLRQNAEEAKAIDVKLSALHRDLFVESNPIPVKWGLSRMQRIGTGIRLPLTVLDSKFHPTLESAMAEANITLK